jgi:tetratricopeptide (TPR) repeat protein
MPVDWQDLVRTYGRPLLLGAAIAATITVGTSYFRGQKRRADEDAARMLSSGRPEQLEALIVQHGKTPSAPVALLALARLDFHNGKYEAAEKRYADFMEKHPGHPFHEAAGINRAQCTEALGRTEEALKAYDAVLARKGGALFAMAAKLGRARCLEQLARYEDARAVYEEVLAADPDGPWAGAADAALKTIDQKKRAAKAAVSVGLPAPAPDPAPVPTPTPAPAPAAPSTPAP